LNGTLVMAHSENKWACLISAYRRNGVLVRQMYGKAT
jgi:hypothetical protein